MKVKYAYLDREYLNFKNKIDDAVQSCLLDGQFILREQVTDFEKRIVDLHQGGYCIGVNSGTDALNIMLKLAKIPKGSGVIVSAHTFVSSVSAIVSAGHIPVFCDINEEGNLCALSARQLIGKKTRGILVTHMNGLMANMESIRALAQEAGLIVFEDAAQAIGSLENGRPPGSLSNGAAYSLHPLKTLSVAGDGGFIVTNDEEMATKARAYRNLGQLTKGFYEIEGCNSRLDNVQAAIANVKLPALKHLIAKRVEHANAYTQLLKNVGDIKVPDEKNDSFFHTFSNYVINTSKRDQLAKSLSDSGIEVMIHWNPSVANLKIFRKYVTGFERLKIADQYTKTCLSIPISPWMSEQERTYVISKIIEFYKV
jgi:dTDP-4-amino-4,6-dideoxygalactose transaminase